MHTAQLVASDLEVRTLGAARLASPLAVVLGERRTTQHYVDESDRVLVDDTLSMVEQRGGRSHLPLREPSPQWLRPAIEALAAHVRAGGAKRLAVERFDGEPVVQSEAMELLVESGFLAGPRRAVLRP